MEDSVLVTMCTSPWSPCRILHLCGERWEGLARPAHKAPEEAGGFVRALLPYTTTLNPTLLLIPPLIWFSSVIQERCSPNKKLMISSYIQAGNEDKTLSSSFLA